MLKSLMRTRLLTAAGLGDAGRATQDVHEPVQRVDTWRRDGPRLLQGRHGSHHQGAAADVLLVN